MKQIEKIILSYPKLSQYIGDSGIERARSLKNLKEIKAEYSPTFVKKMRELLDLPFGKLYDGIHLDLPNDLDLKKLCDENCVIFVPNHQSHADYLALNYALYEDYKLPIHIAGGINLNIFPIGSMFRKSGCFFIRRRFSDDQNYKYTFEAYLFYLLKMGYPVEFFFEGGRSRTGKLLPPRFGLFQMLLEAHRALIEVDADARPLAFVPVSIMHEFVPEEKSLIKELDGGTKRKESSAQLLKIFKLLRKEMGSIHIKISSPIFRAEEKETNLRKATHKLAFRCYRAVGAGMSVTPVSLLSLILLDDPSGATTWEQIFDRAKLILSYCEQFNVPVTNSIKNNLKAAIDRGLELLIRDKKIKLVEKSKLNQKFYVVDENRRRELLYFKNTILHHFLVPCFMNSALIKVAKGTLKNVSDIKELLYLQRDELKYEFYLPEIRDVVERSLEIISAAIGREMTSIEGTLELSAKELYSVGNLISPFIRAYAYIYEGYYIGALALKHFKDQEFSFEQYSKVAQEIHEIEKEHGRFIHFSEGYSIPLLKNSLLYYENIGLIRSRNNKSVVLDSQKTEEKIHKFINDLNELFAFNVQAAF